VLLTFLLFCHAIGQDHTASNGQPSKFELFYGCRQNHGHFVYSSPVARSMAVPYSFAWDTEEFGLFRTRAGITDYFKGISYKMHEPQMTKRESK